MKPLRNVCITIICYMLWASTNAQPDSTIKALAAQYFTKSFQSAAQRNLDQSILYADSCKRLYEKVGDEWGVAHHEFLLGVHKRVTGEYPQAKAHFEAFRIAMESHRDTSMLASVHFQLGIINEALGHLDVAIDHQYRSIAYYESQGNIAHTNDGLNNLGSIYRKLKQYDKSQELYGRSLDINVATGSISGQATNHVNLGNLYAEQARYDEAIASYTQAVYFDSLDNFIYGLASDYENIGNLLNKQEKYAAALQQQTAALEIRLRLPSAHEKAISYQKTAEVLVHLDRSIEALSLLDSAEAYASKTQAVEVIRDISSTRASAFANLKNFREAYQQERLSSHLQDSILNKSITDQINELNTQYETNEKEKEIALLSAETELQEAKLKVNQNKIIGLVAGLILLAGFLFALFRLYKKTQWQNMIIQQSLDEKEILLREIHHRVKNNLQFISSLLGLQTEHIEDPSALGALQEGQDRVQSMALIHQNLYQEDNLTGVDLRDYFIKLIRGLFDSYNIRKNQVALELEIEDINLDVDTVIPLGLIANELISNSLKYAFKNKHDQGVIKVGLKEINDRLHLLVKDNGTGISSIKMEQLGTSFGYRLIHVLTEQLAAKINVDNSEGTSVNIFVGKYTKT